MRANFLYVFFHPRVNFRIALEEFPTPWAPAGFRTIFPSGAVRSYHRVRFSSILGGSRKFLPNPLPPPPWFPTKWAISGIWATNRDSSELVWTKNYTCPDSPCPSSSRPPTKPPVGPPPGVCQFPPFCPSAIVHRPPLCTYLLPVFPLSFWVFISIFQPAFVQTTVSLPGTCCPLFSDRFSSP